MVYLMIHTTHLIYAYIMSDIMVKDNPDSERENPLLPLHRLLFLISSKGSFF